MIYRCRDCGELVDVESVRCSACCATKGLAANLDRALSLLRDFYVAYEKPHWEEGTTAEELTAEVRIFLDGAAREGFDAARVPPCPETGDDGGPAAGEVG